MIKINKFVRIIQKHYQSFNVNTIIVTRKKKIRERNDKHRDKIDIEVENFENFISEKFRDRYESTNNNIETFRIKKIMHLNNVLNILLIEKQNYKFKIETIAFREIRRY